MYANKDEDVPADKESKPRHAFQTRILLTGYFSCCWLSPSFPLLIWCFRFLVANTITMPAVMNDDAKVADGAPEQITIKVRDQVRVFRASCSMSISKVDVTPLPRLRFRRDPRVTLPHFVLMS